MFNLTFDYLLFTFLSCTGILQIAAAYGQIYGLLFLKKPVWAATLGGSIVIFALLMFFESGPRHVPDTAGGLAGSQNAGVFSLGAIISLIFTLIVSSKLNGSQMLDTRYSEIEDGLDSLKKTTYIRLLIQKITSFRKEVNK